MEKVRKKNHSAISFLKIISTHSWTVSSQTVHKANGKIHVSLCYSSVQFFANFYFKDYICYFPWQ